MKRIVKTYADAPQHWVGNGFPVRTLFSYNTAANISPFLLLDYAGPMDFAPSPHPRGVEMHPHRGFETVSIVYQGEVEHRDTAGNQGRIGPGDVQWMTAARGVLHEEKHGRAFSETGGTLEMVQLWVNLPAKHKMSAPRYQEITDRMIPVIRLDGDGSIARIIAGELAGVNGPAHTFTPIHLWDLRLKAGLATELKLPIGFNTHLLVLKGSVTANGQTLRGPELVSFETGGEKILLNVIEETVLLVMSGEPIDEPLSGQGPFVMNTRDEISQAFSDFRDGKF